MTRNVRSRQFGPIGCALTTALGVTLILIPPSPASAGAAPSVYPAIGQLAWLALGPAPAKDKGDAAAPKAEAEKKAARQREAESGQREFELPPGKADALFALLSPEDVKVRVSRRPGRIFVEGTPQEAAALEHFVALLMRHNGKSADQVRALVDKQSNKWADAKVFKLPSAAADRLLDLLAFDDVPVLVDRVEEGISVAGEAKDLRTINQVAQIAVGKRLEEPGSKGRGERPGRPAPPAEPVPPAPPAPPAPPTPVPPERAERQQALKEQLHRLHEQLEQEMARLREHAERMHREFSEHLDRFERELSMIPRAPGEVPAPPERPDGRLADQPQVRTYRLPPEHAHNLFQLLAPNDVEDVVVSIDGDALTVRAAPRDQETIERLVELLTRGDRRIRVGAQF